MKLKNVCLKGIASYVPPKVVTNFDIEKLVDTTDAWIFSKLGIKERRVAEYENPSDMGTKAAVKAIEDAKISKEDIDMIIVATSSPEQISPATSCIIHKNLDISRNIPAFDINAVCSGFLYAISLASTLISSKQYKNILVIATEAYSKITNWNDKHCVFFGDGAGAVVLGYSENGWICSELEANGKETGMTGFVLPLNSKFIMNGKEVWEQAVKVLPQSIKNILEKSETNISDIKMLVPHQPSINILKIIAKDVGLPFEKVKTVMHKYANIAGSSIPIALDEAIKNKEIIRGDKILLTAIGSGWTWGSMVINYE
jgi:3-oxoacyl-[acyl-carrier-protein] synthase-3